MGKGGRARNVRARSVFYPSGELSAIFIKFGIVVCKLFQFGRVSNLSSGTELKAVWTKEENVGNQYFVILHNVFHPIKDRFQHLRQTEIVSAY